MQTYNSYQYLAVGVEVLEQSPPLPPLAMNNFVLFIYKFSGISKSFDIEPEDQEVEEGGVARFKCHIEGIPPPSYIWEKDSSPLPHNSR